MDIYQIKGQERKRYKGRGLPTRFTWNPLLSATPAGVGRHVGARAWTWLSKELAWCGLLLGKTLKHGSKDGRSRQLGGAWRRLHGSKQWEAIPEVKAACEPWFVHWSLATDLFAAVQ